MDKSKQAFPVPYEHMGGGMTLREYAAVAAMQGICAAYQNRCVFDKNDAEAWAEEAIFIADALIAKLEESNNG